MADRYFESLTCNAGGPKGWREETLKGRKQLVVNMVTITEGVHEGSQGKVYYSKDFLKKRPKSWDHKPAVVYHPENKSACDPSVLNTRAVGVQLETQYAEKDGIGRWKGRAWLDVENLNAVDARVEKKVKNGEKVEVSTGLYIDLKKQKGEWNGEKYDYVAMDYTPDHLAILPDKIGSCSVAKGAGLCQNEAAKLPESLQFCLERTIGRLVQDSHTLELVENELSLSQKSRQLSDLLARRFGDRGQYWRGYVIDVFDSYAVFDSGNGKTYKLSYSATDSAVTLSKDAPTEVTRVVEYQPVKNESQTHNEETQMPFDKKAHVTSLIANGQIKEADRAKYEALTEDVLEGIAVVKPAKEEPAVKNEGKEQPAPPPAKPLSREDWMAAAPPEMVETWNEMATEANKRKTVLVENILKIKDCPYTKEELDGKKIGELEKISALAKASAPAARTNNGAGGFPYIGIDHTLNGAAAPVTNEGKEGAEKKPAAPKPLGLPKLPLPAAAK